MDVAEARERAAHVRHPRRRHRDLVGEADRLRGLEDRVDRDLARARSKSTSVHASNASSMCTSAGDMIFGNSTPARPGPATARRSFKRLTGRRRLHTREHQRQLARHQRVEELARHLAAALAFRLRIRRLRLLEVDDHRVGTRRARRRQRVGVVTRREHHRPQRTGVVAVHNHTSPTSASACVAAASHTVPSKNRGFGTRVQAHRVHEREVAEVALGDHAVLDQLVRLGHRLGHVAHVPVRDVGAEHRPQPGRPTGSRRRGTPTPPAGRRLRTRSRSWARSACAGRRRCRCRRPRTRRPAPDAPPDG